MMWHKRKFLTHVALFPALGASMLARADSLSDFFSAIRYDHAYSLEKLLARGFDPNSVNSEGQAGLLVAMRESSFVAAKVLIKARGIRVEVRNAKDESPLMLAAIKGQLELVKMLIDRDADVNKTGWTPLHYACSSDGPQQVDIVRVLLDKSAYIDAQSPNNTTPLMMACMYGSRDSVRLLLEEGADPSLRNDQKLSAADFALRAQREDVAQTVLAAVRKQSSKGSW